MTKNRMMVIALYKLYRKIKMFFFFNQNLLFPLGCTVSLHYTGTLVDGTVFDSSVERNEPFEFELGKGRVIKGFEIFCPTMRKGEKSVLTCAPEYGYGPAGSPPKIPANSTLRFEV